MKIPVSNINRSFQVHTSNTQIRAVRGTMRTGISFKNVGDTIAKLNGITLSPGDPMLSMSSELLSDDQTRYDIIFQSPIGSDPRIEVIETYISKVVFIDVEEALVTPFER